MTYALAFDAVIAVLLVITIVYAVILNRKLSALRDAKGEMERLLLGFAEATGKAEQGLAAFRDAADGAGKDLQRQIQTARALADDLAFLVQRGAGLADRLDGANSNDRGAGRAETTVATAPGEAAKPTASSRHRAAGLATAALGSEGETVPEADQAISSKQAALLKALNAIR